MALYFPCNESTVLMIVGSLMYSDVDYEKIVFHGY